MSNTIQPLAMMSKKFYVHQFQNFKTVFNPVREFKRKELFLKAKYISINSNGY